MYLGGPIFSPKPVPTRGAKQPRICCCCLLHLVCVVLAFLTHDAYCQIVRAPDLAMQERTASSSLSAGCERERGGILAPRCQRFAGLVRVLAAPAWSANRAQQQQPVPSRQSGPGARGAGGGPKAPAWCAKQRTAAERKANGAVTAK
jgi:hypothetical protein